MPRKYTSTRYAANILGILAWAFGVSLYVSSRQPAPYPVQAAAPVNRLEPHGPDTFEPRGYRRYLARFAWTAPSGEVAIWASDGGTNWMQLGNQGVITGTNEITLLIPEWYCRYPAARPRLRIGTLDRQYGFETALHLNQKGE